MKNTVLAIDFSLKNTSVFYGDDKLHTHETFKSDAKKYGPTANEANNRMRRWDDFVAKIMQWIEANKDPLDDVVVVIEGYSFNSFGTSIYTGEVGGLLRWHLTDIGPLVEVTPGTLKKFATGKGDASKVEVATALTRRWDAPEFKTDDEYDAYAMFLMGTIAVCGVKEKTKFERVEVDAAFSKLRKD